MATKVLDSWALIAFFEDEPAAEAVEKLLAQTAIYKATHTMSYADCFTAALAKVKNAELLTGDPEFKAVEKEIKITWLK